MKYVTILCLLTTSIHFAYAECDKSKDNKEDKKPNGNKVEQIEKPIHKCPPFIIVNDNIIVKSCT